MSARQCLDNAAVCESLMGIRVRGQQSWLRIHISSSQFGVHSSFQTGSLLLNWCQAYKK